MATELIAGQPTPAFPTPQAKGVAGMEAPRIVSVPELTEEKVRLQHQLSTAQTDIKDLTDQVQQLQAERKLILEEKSELEILVLESDIYGQTLQVSSCMLLVSSTSPPFIDRHL